jgi:hypothetical protein
MNVILHICWQIQHTCSCVHYVNSGPCQIQRYCSSAYSDFNIHLNISPLLLVICRQFNAHCIPHLLINTAHVIRLKLCQLCALSNPAYLQFSRFCPIYSFVRTSVTIGDMSTIRSALCSTFAAKYDASAPDYIVTTLVKAKSNVIAVLHI